MRGRKNHDPELRRRVVEDIRGGMALETAARGHGVNPSTVYAWPEYREYRGLPMVANGPKMARAVAHTNGALRKYVPADSLPGGIRIQLPGAVLAVDSGDTEGLTTIMKCLNERT